MPMTIDYLLNELKDPKKEIHRVREGIPVYIVESFLNREALPVKEMLEHLSIPASTYFAKKKSNKALDTYSSEKFIRLITVIISASDLLGKEEAKTWLHQKIPSLGNEIPLNLLDTEAGHQLVLQLLLQIKHGIYS